MDFEEGMQEDDSNESGDDLGSEQELLVGGGRKISELSFRISVNGFVGTAFFR